MKVNSIDNNVLPRTNRVFSEIEHFEESKDIVDIGNSKEIISPIIYKNIIAPVSGNIDLQESLVSEVHDSAVGVEEVENSVIMSFLEKAYLVSQEDKAHKTNKVSKKILIPSIICGIGTGFAMMPIFNNEVEKLERYGINVHGSEAAFAVSTLNTLFIQSLHSILLMYHLLNDLGEKSGKHLLPLTSSKTTLAIGAAGALFTSLLPISQLWEVELQDQKISDSEGFDKFIAWAAFCTLPLLIIKTFKAFEILHNQLEKNKWNTTQLDSIGAKIFTNVPVALASVGRFVAYSAGVYNLGKAMDFGEDAAISTAIVIGSISSTLIGIAEYLSTKSLFNRQSEPMTKKEMALGLFSTLEGAWFSLPVISTGLNATKGWNPLLQSLTFAPFFVTHTILEANNIYNVLKPKQGHSVNEVV